MSGSVHTELNSNRSVEFFSKPGVIPGQQHYGPELTLKLPFWCHFSKFKVDGAYNALILP